MLVMIGASASGKTEIAKILIREYGFEKMITYTTREKRLGEIHGIDYYFISESAFLEKKLNHEFIETISYNGRHYGTAFDDTALNKVLIVDPSGASVLKEKLDGNTVFFFLECPKEIRAQRMRARGDHLTDIKKRLEKDALHFDKARQNYRDYTINTSEASLEALAQEIFTLYARHIDKNI